MLRTSLRPGLLKAIAFNESHRRTGVALFEIGHVYPPGDGELPDEYEALGVVLAGRDAPAAMDGVAGGRSGDGRRRARRPGRSVPPGLHPTRSATLSLGRDVDRRGRRDRIPTCSRRSVSTSVSPCSSST